MPGQKIVTSSGAGPVPEGLMEAALTCCGEVGYRKLSTGIIAQRYGGSRSNFYRYFDGKADCFQAAYSWKAGQLVERLLVPSGAGGCDVHAALLTLGDFLANDPLVARAVLGEVQGAGAAVGGARREILQRLTSSLDAGLRQRAETPPPLAGEFVVSAIEQLALQALTKGEIRAFRREAKGLAILVHRLYGLPEHP